MSDNAVKQLAEKVAELEAKVDPRKAKPTAPAGPTLAECNRRYLEAYQEVEAEKRTAAEVAKKAIDEAFRDKGRIQQKRVLKEAVPHAVEMRVQAAKK